MENVLEEGSVRARGSLRGRIAGFGDFYFILFFAVKRKGENMYLKILSSEEGVDDTPRSRGSPQEKEQVLAGTRGICVRGLLAVLAIQEQESEGELWGRWEGLG